MELQVFERSELRAEELEIITSEIKKQFRRYPWNEYLMCPQCKAAEDYGPSFSWGLEDAPWRCPRCGSELIEYWSAERVSKYFIRKGGVLKVGYLETEFAAWALGYPLDEETFYLDTVGVMPQFRKVPGVKKFLGQLYEKMFAPLSAQGFRKVVSRTHQEAKNVQILMRYMGFVKKEASPEDPQRIFWELHLNSLP